MILKKSKKEKDTTELAVQKKTLTPEQKKKRKRRIIVGVAAVAVAGFAVSRALTPAALPTVMVRSAQVGNIEQTVDASGTVTTEESKTYFSPIGAKVSECKVQAGDAVAAGDVMLVYDAQDLEEKQKEAELQIDEAGHDGLAHVVIRLAQLLGHGLCNLDGGAFILLGSGQCAVALIFAQVRPIRNRHPAEGCIVTRSFKCFLHFRGDDVQNFLHNLSPF